MPAQTGAAETEKTNMFKIIANGTLGQMKKQAATMGLSVKRHLETGLIELESEDKKTAFIGKNGKWEVDLVHDWKEYKEDGTYFLSNPV